MKPPKELSPGYTDHDAHGYQNGLGPCVCADCKTIHAKAAKEGTRSHV